MITDLGPIYADELCLGEETEVAGDGERYIFERDLDGCAPVRLLAGSKSDRQ
ncbi:hypothetical protein GCM10009827_119460 [Dactylosporangium maewongense]|uniref:Uncharacterized protein n=1 Tax=Dactylosporangium maewongense TaxID=634393 RepID=A0ABP4PEJ1_9ACTN